MRQNYKRRLIKYLAIARPLILVGIFFLGVGLALKLLSPLYLFIKANNLTPQFFKSVLFDREAPIKKYKERTNVILLGVSGGREEGADLTDTIIFLSLEWQKKDLVMVSLPRDLWMPDLKDKLNTAYHYGEEKKKGAGFTLAKAEIESVVGLPVHFAWLIDFSGFKKIIDLIEGVDVFIEEPFTDKFYPIAGKEDDSCAGDPTFACRYETLQFKAGWQHMDGELALKYVRSRQAEGEEGTDFGRSRRQQQVILALKEKFLTTSFFKNLVSFEKLFKAFEETTETDMNWSEKILFFKYFLNLSPDEVRKIVLDTGDEKKGIKGFLVNPPPWQYNGAWVLVPRTGDFEEIKKYLACQIEDQNCQMKP